MIGIPDWRSSHGQLVICRAEALIIVLLGLFFGCPAAEDSANGADLYFSVATDGFFAGKKPLNELVEFENSSNNHGIIYGNSRFLIGLDSLNNLAVGLRISTPEFSSTERSEIDPYLRLSVGYPEINSSVRWWASFGETGLRTVGTGLTLKDFRNYGAVGCLSVPYLEFTGSYFGQGYRVLEDIGVAGVIGNYAFIRVGTNAIYWTFEGSDIVGYLLPVVHFDFPWFSIYAEYGYKRVWDKGDEKYGAGTGDRTSAFNAGISYSDTIFGIGVRMNPEVRYYSEDFIPRTGVDEKYLTRLENDNLPQNNWIDFFDSNEKSFWYYHKIEIESPKLRNFSVFAANEFLWFESPQDTIIKKIPQRAALSYKPSTSYYWFGVNYHLKDFATLSLRLTNHMLNADPRMEDYEGKSQYMRRFYPMETPLAEFRVEWSVD